MGQHLHHDAVDPRFATRQRTMEKLPGLQRAHGDRARIGKHDLCAGLRGPLQLRHERPEPANLRQNQCALRLRHCPHSMVPESQTARHSLLQLQHRPAGGQRQRGEHGRLHEQDDDHRQDRQRHLRRRRLRIPLDGLRHSEDQRGQWEYQRHLPTGIQGELQLHQGRIPLCRQHGKRHVSRAAHDQPPRPQPMDAIGKLQVA